MTLTDEQLRSIPLLSGLTDSQLAKIRGLFTRRELGAKQQICRAGERASAFYFLASGEVEFSEGDDVKMVLVPPAPIGELGALADLDRNTTVTALAPTVLWESSREALHELLRSDGESAVSVYRKLLQLVADKIRRDGRRLDDMRHNIIRTQKQMKALRDFLLESEDTPVSDRLHDTLEQLIYNNRRANYRVAPPSSLPADVRADDGKATPIAELSRTHFSYHHTDGQKPEAGDRFSGVLVLAGPEIPISGKIIRALDSRVTVELDGLIDDYAAILEGYLSRSQMVNFVV